MILIDCDGVLADFVGPLCARLTDRGFPRTPEDFKSWHLSEALSKEEAAHMLEICCEPGHCEGLPWYPGAEDFLRNAQKLAPVLIVTAPFDASPWWLHERKQWIGQRAPVAFVPGAYKRHVRGDVLIEDNPETAAQWVDDNPDGAAILMDRPWTRGAIARERIYRAHTFTDALSMVLYLTPRPRRRGTK